jgi:hypothetical protein
MAFSYTRVRRSHWLGEEISSKFSCREGWIRKDHDSISWIGGEEFSSRGHTCQGEERAKSITGGFQLIEARGKRSAVWKLSYRVFVHVHGSQWWQSHMYIGLLKERCVHLGKRVCTGSYINSCIARFVHSVYSLSGSFSLLREP